MLQNEMNLKRQIIQSDDKKKRFEMNFTYETNEKKEKNIIVIGLFPSSNSLYTIDMTTNYILNNLLSMKYTSITICNLFATVATKLTSKNMADNIDNMNYLEEALAKNYDTVLIGYGNSMAGNTEFDLPDDNYNWIQVRWGRHPMRNNRVWQSYDMVLKNGSGKIYVIYSITKRKAKELDLEYYV